MQDLFNEPLALHALALPDGNIFSSGGGGAGAVGKSAYCCNGAHWRAMQRSSDDLHGCRQSEKPNCLRRAGKILYCEKGIGSVQVVGQMTVPRAGIHGTYHLYITGEPFQSAYDRTAISRANNRQFPPSDVDLAVNSTQIFTPPYLYDSSVPCPTSVGCKLAKRPVILKGPDFIQYGTKFKLNVDDASVIKMVSLIRTGSATHTLAQDQLYVRIPFKVINDTDNLEGGKGKVTHMGTI